MRSLSLSRSRDADDDDEGAEAEAVGAEATFVIGRWLEVVADADAVSEELSVTVLLLAPTVEEPEEA